MLQNRKLKSLISLILLLSIIWAVSYASEEDFNLAKPKIDAMRLTNPNLPTTAGEPQGSIWFIMSRLFDSDGKISNWFLKALWTRSDNAVLRWEWWNGGQFVESNISDDGTDIKVSIPTSWWEFEVEWRETSYWRWNSDNAHVTFKNDDAANAWGIKPRDNSRLDIDYNDVDFFTILPNGNVGIGDTGPSYKLDITWDINFTGDIRKGGSILNLAWKFQDGATSGEVYYNGWNVGIGNTDPAYTLDVSGTINATNLRWNGSQITGITSAGITDGTITRDDLATNSITSAKILDWEVTSADINNNTITETDISDSFVARDSNLLDGIDSTGFFTKTEIPGLETNSWDGIASQNASWYIRLWPANASHAHIYTDRPTFYFNKDLLVNGAEVLKVGSSWDGIADGTIDASELAANSVWNSELIDNPSFTRVTATSAPTSWNHLTNKTYVDNLVTQWVSWKAPSPTSAAATHGTCDGTKQGWTTYNQSDELIYACNGSSWVSIGSSATVPYATTSTAGRIQLSGDIGGTWNNIELGNNTVESINIVNGTIDTADIASNAIVTSKIPVGAITSSKILDNTITASDIWVDAVTASELADNSVASANIINNSIASSDIASNLTYTDTSANSTVRALTLTNNISWATATTADRTHSGLRLDINSSATGGDTDDEHRVYGIEADIDVTGDSDLVYGMNVDTRTNHSSWQISALRWVYSWAQSTSSALVSSIEWGNFTWVQSSSWPVSNVYGVNARALKSSASTNTTTNFYGIRGEVEMDAGTITNARWVYSAIDIDGWSMVNWYLFHGDYQGAFPTNAYGVYIEDAVDNYFGWRITVAMDPNSWDDVGNRDYNDARYIAAWSGISWDLITDNTLDSSEIEDDSIVDADINASAAISGLKIFPNFGSQWVLAGWYFYSSDERLKYNIEKAPWIETALKLSGRKFTWKHDNADSYGFIAQEVEEVLPELIWTNDSGMKSVQYGNITAILVEAIKDQQAQIDELTREISILKK